MVQTTVTVKGQVTIPKAVRDRAGIKPGGRVEVTNGENGEVSVRPVDCFDPVDRERRRIEIRRILDHLGGSIKLGISTDEYMATIRDPVFP